MASWGWPELHESFSKRGKGKGEGREGEERGGERRVREERGEEKRT